MKKISNQEMDEYGFKDKKCNLCNVNDVCIGLIKEYAMLYGTKELKPMKNG